MKMMNGVYQLEGDAKNIKKIDIYDNGLPMTSFVLTVLMFGLLSPRQCLFCYENELFLCSNETIVFG